MSLDYGVIGNCRTIALVKGDTSVDWLCFPKFNSPSIFSKLLDEQTGGSFRIVPTGDYYVKQSYVEGTNVVRTVFSNSDAEFEVMDYYPYYERNGTVIRNSEMHRVLVRRRGKPKVRVVIDPKMDYNQYIPSKKLGAGNLEFSYWSDTIYAYSNLDLKSIMGGAEVELPERSYVILAYNKLKYDTNVGYITKEMDDTIEYWRKWSAKVKKVSRYNELLTRSALVLKLLTYDDSGAIVAAGTTSLPEIAGSVRNWDYRYAWVRDSAFTELALVKLGLMGQAFSFMNWLNTIYAENGANLQALFAVNGEKNISERFLENLQGYRGSRPVRIGNEAYKQRQIDIVGELMEALHAFYLKHLGAGKKFVAQEVNWDLVYSLVETAIREWREKDHSIWEFRGTYKHYTYSKMMCWVAVDRGVKIAMKLGMKDVVARWAAERELIKKSILKHGWSAKKKAFVQAYGSDNLDASLLLMPFFGMLSWKDKRVVSTIDAINKELRNGPFVMRYKGEDEFGMPKNAFIMCSFWMIDALRGVGRKEEAKEMFRQVISFRNHMGLLSEDIEMESRELLGNFPQAYSHTAMINTIMGLFGSKR